MPRSSSVNAPLPTILSSRSKPQLVSCQRWVRQKSGNRRAKRSSAPKTAPVSTTGGAGCISGSIPSIGGNCIFPARLSSKIQPLWRFSCHVSLAPPLGHFSDIQPGNHGRRHILDIDRLHPHMAAARKRQCRRQHLPAIVANLLKKAVTRAKNNRWT